MYPQSSFIIKNYEGFGGNFVDSQNLAFSYNSDKPHVFENLMMKMYSSQSRFFALKPLLNLTGGTGNVMDIDNEVYRWYLQGADERVARAIENLETANTAAGLNNTVFRIKLDVDYYMMPDVLLPEDNAFPLAIVEGPIQDGTGYIYLVKLQTDSPTAFLPNYLMDPGAKFYRAWTSVSSEFNGVYGTQQAPSSLMLEHQISTFAHKITVTDKALRQAGRLGVTFMATDTNGKTSKVDKFTSFYESRMRDTFYKEMEVQAVFGKKSTSAGPDKYWIKTGAGVREQMKGGFSQTFNGPVTTTLLQDFLMNILFSKEDVTSREVVLMTGTGGATMFHQAVANLANGFLTTDTKFIGNGPNVGSTPGLSFGAQYTKYYGLNGLVITVVQTPLYDDFRLCGRVHPQYPQFPIDSFRMTFLDFGTNMEGRKNIQLLRLRDSYSEGYTQNMVGPNGLSRGGVVGSGKHGYDVFIQGTMGVTIFDATRTAELILDAE